MLVFLDEPLVFEVQFIVVNFNGFTYRLDQNNWSVEIITLLHITLQVEASPSGFIISASLALCVYKHKIVL